MTMIDYEHNSAQTLDHSNIVPAIENSSANNMNADNINANKINEDKIYAANQKAESAYLDDNRTVSWRVAGFWTRFWAFLIDLAVIGMSSQIFFRIIWPGGLETTTVKSFILINALFPGIWGSVYFVLMTMFWGQTLGKFIQGIKVVRKDGFSLNWGTVVMREVAGRTISQLLGTYLGYLVCAFHPRKQSLSDLLSDTYVVYADNKKSGRWVEIPAGLSTRVD